MIHDRESPLGEAIARLRLEPDPSDHILDKDIILVWGDERRVITGADILGRLLRGVIQRKQTL